MSEQIFELWQGDKKFITGTKQDLAEFTDLSLSTINNYCTPGYLESRPNETDIKVFNVTDEVNKSESRIQSEIILEVNKRGHRLWRANAGRVQDARTGTWIKLLPKGFSDTFGIRSDGKAIFIEIKNDKGKLRPEQIKFRDAVLNFPVIYGVARSAQEAVDIIEGGAVHHD